jgi:FkbM family methyltransferase
MLVHALLMKIRPLWLREKIYYRFFFQRLNKTILTNLFEAVPLEFNSKIRLKLEPKDTGHQAIAFCGYYELQVSQRIVELARKGGVFVDVGANYGYYSCLWAGANSQNKVIAFEASPRNSTPLRSNIFNNQLSSQVEIHDVAIGKEKGNLPFNFMSDEQTGWGGLSPLKENNINIIHVPVVTLDEFCDQNLGEVIIDVLKIDTEGADTWVLQGASRLLKEKKIKHIFFEENLVRMSELGICNTVATDLLVSSGYQITKIGQGEYYATIN